MGKRLRQGCQQRSSVTAINNQTEKERTKAMENNGNEMINAEEFYQDNCQEAEKMLQDPGKIDKLLKRLEKKLSKIKRLPAKAVETLTYVPKMGMLLNSYLRGDYTEIPVGIITAIIGVLVYFVSPIDTIPDFLGAPGYIDDAAVVAGSLYLVKNDIDEYMAWRINTGLDVDEMILDADVAID